MVKVTTVITLSAELLTAIDQFSDRSGTTRSQFIETAVRAYITQMKCHERNVRDLEIINQQAGRLNEEAADVLEYQSLMVSPDAPDSL